MAKSYVGYWQERTGLRNVAVAGGLFALVYSGLTTTGIDFFFGEPTSELFAGRWW